MVRVEGLGEVTVDISYGGAFYAFVNAQRFGLDVTKSKTGELANVATAVTNAVRSQVTYFCRHCVPSTDTEQGRNPLIKFAFMLFIFIVNYMHYIF